METLFPTTSNATLAMILRRTVPSITLQAARMQIKKSRAYRGCLKGSNAFLVLNLPDRAVWLREQHWELNKPAKLIAEELGMGRRNLQKHFKEAGVPIRTIAQDNARRYEGMSYEDRMAQVAAAHAAVAALNGEGSSLEVAIRDELDQRGIRYEHQKRVGPFYVDFYLPDQDLIIECDGEYWHSRPDQVKRDRCKNHWLWRHGKKYVRVAEREIKTSPPAALDRALTS